MSEQKNDKSGKNEKKDDEKWLENYRRLAKEYVVYDPRFPNKNQTRNCEQNYADYYKCLKKKDENYCAWYKNVYTKLCPPDWTDRWDEQRANGSFPIPECL